MFLAGGGSPLGEALVWLHPPMHPGEIAVLTTPDFCIRQYDGCRANVLVCANGRQNEVQGWVFPGFHLVYALLPKDQHTASRCTRPQRVERLVDRVERVALRHQLVQLEAAAA